MLDTLLNVGGDGYYTLVISSAANKPGNLAEQQATWMDWGPFLDGQLSYRMLYRENPHVVAIAAALSGASTEPSPSDYVLRAMPCSKQNFERGGWRACL